MNYKEANSVRDLAALVCEVLEKLDVECDECKGLGEIDYESWVGHCEKCNRIGKVKYIWTPQEGEWFAYGFTSVGLITNVRGNQWLTLHNSEHEYHKDNGNPIPKWEEIERILKKAGYKTMDKTMDKTDDGYSYYIDWKGNRAWAMEDTRPKAVMKAVIKLGKELK